MLNNFQNSIKNITMTPIPLIFTMNPIPTPPEFLLPRYQTYIGGAREKLPEKYADGMGIEYTQRWYSFGNYYVLHALKMLLILHVYWNWIASTSMIVSNRAVPANLWRTLLSGPTRAQGGKQHNVYLSNRQEEYMLRPNQSSLMRNKLRPTQKSTNIKYSDHPPA